MIRSKTFLVLAGFLFFSATQEAQAGYITISKSEIEKVIGSFPANGTAEEANDDAQLLEYQDTRTKAQCAAAQAQSDDSLKTLFGNTLSKKELAWLNIRLLRVRAIAGANATIAKNMYNRPRPYTRNKDIKPCIELESSSSYPSGHATQARLLARVLSLRYPSRAATFMKAADQAATNRVLGGVHHPSDIAAGKKLGDYLAKKYYY